MNASHEKIDFCAQQIIETNKMKFNKCTFSKVRNFC